MRNIRLSKLNNSQNEQDFFYCFDVTTEEGELYFCSHNIVSHINGIDYTPNSSLSLKEVTFNENANDYAIICGIFEEGGIVRDSNILGQKIRCYIALQGKLYQYFTFNCSNFAKGDLDFELTLEPETMKLSKNLLLRYSKTCRANFADSKCKVNISDYLQSFHVHHIEHNVITVDYQQPEEDYFAGGRAMFTLESGMQHNSKIIAHQNNIIILSDPLPPQYLSVVEVALIPTCDKNFITCCKKFNNAVNFRGEPALPDDNFLLN